MPSGLRSAARPTVLRALACLVILFVSLASLAPATFAAPRPSEADGEALGAVSGQVRDRASGLPIAGAVVSAPDLNLSGSSDAEGEFGWSHIAVPPPYLPITVLVSAEGYGLWTLRDVRVVPGDTLKLSVELGPDPVTITVPPPRAESPVFPPQQLLPALLDGFGGGATTPALPATLRVRITGDPYCNLTLPYTVETVDFKEYVKHVLPNEWVPSWPWESVRSGAMAAKMYAWSIVAAGGKWPDADVYDSTCDQVYNPAVSYASTDLSVDFTWNWMLHRSGTLVRTYYRARLYQCPEELIGNCMGQYESRDMARNGLTWDEILTAFYPGGVLSPIVVQPGGYSLRYFGNGYGDLDRVKIVIDSPPRPVDVSGDFTMEWWMKAVPGENDAPSCTPGGENWIFGNTLLDRDIYGAADNGDWGVSLADGRIAFGVAVGGSGHTACGMTSLSDNTWHHVAVTRCCEGLLRVFVDGKLDAEGSGPIGDISYRDGRTTSYPDDPYLVIGAEKHDAGPAYPSFSGWIDELHISNISRYAGEFTPPEGLFTPDANTVALFHFNEGVGNVIADSSAAVGGPSTGYRYYGGVINGPEWTEDSPWYVPPPTPTLTPTPSPTAVFGDVPSDHWAFHEIQALFEAGYVSGCSADPRLYCPEASMTRAESAVFVERGLHGGGFEPGLSPVQVFQDVLLDQWYARWAHALWVDGYTAGCGTDPLVYCPEVTHTRAEATVFFLRMLNGPDFTPLQPTAARFADVPLDTWYAPWVHAADDAGLILPCATEPDRRFCPEDPLTRSMAAYMMIQAKGGLPLPTATPTPSPNATTPVVPLAPSEEPPTPSNTPTPSSP